MASQAAWRNFESRQLPPAADSRSGSPGGPFSHAGNSVAQLSSALPGGGAVGNLRKGLDKFRGLDDAVGDLDAPILYQKLVNQCRGVRVSLLDQGEKRVLARPWDLWPRIEYRE